MKKANHKDKERNHTVDVLALLDLVPFGPDNVMDACCGNTVLYVEAIRYRLQCLERANDAKRAWEQANAELDLKLRKDARSNGEKTTEGEIDAKILRDKAVSQLAKAHHQANIYEEYSKLIVKVFEMRRDMLETVANLVNREYPISKVAEQTATRMQRERQKLRQRFPEE
jgi:hypothetical protein